MIDPRALFRLTLLSSAAWAACVVFDFIVIGVTAAVLDRAPLSTVSTVAIILVVVEFLLACGSVAFVLIRSRRYVENPARRLWVTLFAVLQLVTLIPAALTTLLALNR